MNSLGRDKLIKELTSFTPADIAVMEEQAAEYLQHTGQRARRKYARYLKIQLADRPENPPREPQQQQQQRFDPLTEAWIKRTTKSDRFWTVAIFGPIAAGAFIGIVCGVLWVLQQIVRAVVR